MRLTLTSLLALAGIFSSAAPATADTLLTYWSNSDRCENASDGMILVVANAEGNLVCKRLKIERSGSNSIWSVSMGGVCLDIQDTSSAADFCTRFTD